jgi:hypothetical protein
MKTYDWVNPDYRPIPEWPTYVMSASLDVWSLSRPVKCRGGTRLTTARQLVPDDGRVRLSENGQTARFHVANQLFPKVFPELRRTYQPFCRNGHPLMHPLVPIFGSLDTVRVDYWGTGNRVCRWCNDAPAESDSGYSSIYGVSGVPYYSELPAQPKQTSSDPIEFEGQGYRVTNRPVYNLPELKEPLPTWRAA